MELHTILALILSGAVGVSLGLLGGGGSILAMPVLIYVAGIDVKESVGMSLAIVGSTSLVGSLLHACEGRMDLRVAAIFGSAGAIGAYFGSKLTHLVSSGLLLLLFALLMFVIAILMITRRERHEESHAVRPKGNLQMTLLSGLIVGTLTGFLGIGGGFLVVPALVLFAGLPMHIAIGTSLLVIAINSAAGYIGHLRAGSGQTMLTLVFTAAAVMGVFTGQQIARRLHAQKLRRAFAYFVMLVAIAMMAANYKTILAL